MIVKNIMEKLKTVLSLVCRLLKEGLFYFMPLWKMVQSFIDYLYQRLFREDSIQRQVPKRRLDELQLWNCFSYYPAVTSWEFLVSQSGKYIGKDKKWYRG